MLGAMDKKSVESRDSIDEGKRWKWKDFTDGQPLSAADLNGAFDAVINNGVDASKIQWGDSVVHTNYCADCYSKDYETKTPATFIAHGFSVCEEHFKKYCENQKKVYEKTFKEGR